MPASAESPSAFDQAAYQRQFYDKHFARRAGVLKEQLEHPLFRSWYDRLAGKAFDAIAAHGGQRVRLLEVATGEGLWANALHRVAAERTLDLVYTGTDLSQSAIDQTSAAVPGTFLLGDCIEQVAALPPASVDLILVKNLLHHIDDPAGLLRAARAALAPGGVILAVEARLLSPWLWGFIALAPVRERYFFQGRRRNARAAEAAGLDIRREERWSSLPYEMLFTIKYGQFRRWLSSADPKRIERITRWDERGAKLLPVFAAYRLWELVPRSITT
ncbi:MAG: class I SAM-dependent methyltransferase [Acidimicrobiales bacterium]